MQDDCVARLRALNDELRKHHRGGQVMVTAGLHASGPMTVRDVLAAVAAFDSFDSGNDPYGEHDFGKVAAAGLMVFFKIDYYDLEGRYRSEDPANPAVTRRVMTVMLTDEY